MLVMVLLVILAGWLDARLEWNQITDERKEKTS
jgi:uncharacterized paraquat-inducible protein A